ncbi:MAG: hypothetical protein EOO99_07825 [Pedobacter sp.]|nr:MAG: hypothetical protein EOO99_07825 [Pedobacter sp.]
MKQINFYVWIMVIVFVFSACIRDKKVDPALSDTSQTAIIQASPKAEKYTKADTVKAVGQEVILAFERKDYTELVKYFSTKGVLFSPYANLAPRKQVKLTGEEFLAAIKSKQVYKWGEYDGTGEEIKLTLADYLQKFVTKAPFSEAEAISFDAVMKKGNTIDNIWKIFPEAHYVEYHFSGIDPQYEGMDWTSLRLVFECIDDEYYLVAVVQDQWTV